MPSRVISPMPRPPTATAIEAWRALPAADAEAFANALVQLAGIHYRLNDFARASGGYAEAIALEETRLGADHDDLLGLLSIRAGLELKLGHAVEAERLLRRQLDTIVRVRGVDRREAASVMDHLAEALSLLGPETGGGGTSPKGQGNPSQAVRRVLKRSHARQPTAGEGLGRPPA